MKQEIKIRKRTQTERQSFIEGFKAGVKMAQDSITANCVLFLGQLEADDEYYQEQKGES